MIAPGSAGHKKRRGTTEVLLGVTGSIAAYKSLELVRLFRKAGWSVTVVMTRHAARLVGPESFAALSGRPVALELFPRHRPVVDGTRIEHVGLAAGADLIVVAPATANLLGKLAGGIADDLLSTLLLAVPEATLKAGRVILAPAMNANMWSHPSVRKNTARLLDLGCTVVGPQTGGLACGDQGPGRLADPATIFHACRAALDKNPLPDLSGTRVLVSTGRTEEPLDPVRVITNRSSGLTGIEIARAFAAARASVHLISGPTSVALPAGIRTTRVRTADRMQQAILDALTDTDVLVMCAAVADYRPAGTRKTKRRQTTLTLELERTPDILKQVSKAKHNALVIGFSHDPSLTVARAKLLSKKLDLIVANPFATADSDTIRPTLVFPGRRSKKLPEMPKADFACRLVAETAGLLSVKPGQNND